MRTPAKICLLGTVGMLGCSRCGAPAVSPAIAPEGPPLLRVVVPYAAPGRAMIRVDVTRDGIELDLDDADSGWAPAWRDDAKARQVEFTSGRHPILPLHADAGADLEPLVTALQNTLAMESRYGAPDHHRAARVDLLINPDVPSETVQQVWGALGLANVARVGLAVKAGSVEGVLEVQLPQVSTDPAAAPPLGGPLAGVPDDAPLRAQLAATFTGAFGTLPADVTDADAPWHGAFFVSLSPDGLRWAELGRTGAPPAVPLAAGALRTAVEKTLAARKAHPEPEGHAARLTVVRGTSWTAWVQAVAALEAPAPSGALSPVWVAWSSK